MRGKTAKDRFIFEMTCIVFIGLFVFISCSPSGTGEISSPDDFLGHKLGETMTRVTKIYDYMRMLDKESDRVKVITLGKSYRGQEMIAAIISDPENIKKLDHYIDINNKISDPRMIADDAHEKLFKEGKVFFLVEMGMHSSELGNVEAAVPIAHTLATTDNPELLNSLKNVILILNPCEHPDGYDDTVDWYEKYKDKKYWGSPPYYGDFVSHDDNRCVMRLKPQHIFASQEAHSKFKPELVWNMHQGAATEGAFNFVAAEPKEIYPTVDWLTVLPSYMIISGVFSEMYADGFKNIVWRTGGGYSPWYVGCADTMPMYHNSIGICWEVGCRNIPELGWGAVYSKEIVVNSVKHIGKHKELLLENKYKIAKKIVDRGTKEAPYAWIVPCIEQKDPAVTAEMINALLDLGVEVHKLEKESEVNKKTYPAGSYLIRLDQPLGGLAQACMEKQDFRVTGQAVSAKTAGWTFPLMMGVKADRIDSPEILSMPVTLIDEAIPPDGKIVGDASPRYFIIKNEMNNVAIALNRMFKNDVKVFWSKNKFNAGGESFPKGTIIIPVSEGVSDVINALVGDLYLTCYGVDENLDVNVQEIKPPRLAAFHGWTDNMNDGWNRLVYLGHEFPFERITNPDVINGNLNERFDVICIPDMREKSIIEGRTPRSGSDSEEIEKEEIYPDGYRGGIGEDGVENLKKYVKAGGTLIVINNASDLVINNFNAGIQKVKTNKDEFACRGSILAGRVFSDTPAGFSFAGDPNANLFFSNGPLIKVINPSAKIIAKYASENVELSGFLKGEKHIADKVAAVEIPYGKGKIIMFTFSVVALYQSQNDFPMLFNSIFSSNTQPAELN